MENQTVKRLKALAKERGIKGYYELRKAELIEALGISGGASTTTGERPNETQHKSCDRRFAGNIPDELVLSQKCTVCKLTKPANDFNTIKRNGNTMLSKSCILCNLIKTKEKNKRKEGEFARLWMREDGSKITDPYEIVDDNKPHRCNICHAWKTPREFSIIALSSNPRLTKGCLSCLEQNRKDIERRKSGNVKDSWYWNGHLITRKKEEPHTKFTSTYMTEKEIAEHHLRVQNIMREVLSSNRGFER